MSNAINLNQPFSAQAYTHIPDYISQEELKYQRLKVTVHKQLIEALDLDRIEEVEVEDLRRNIHALVVHLIKQNPELFAGIDQARLESDLVDEVFGHGPIEPLLRDDTISDILVNGPYTVYIERAGRVSQTDVIFANDEHLLHVIRRIVGRLGRRLDESHPMVDARLDDGSRVNAVIPPLVLNGPTLSIRRFGKRSYTIEELLGFGTLPEQFATFMNAAIRSRIGTLFSGGTGSGKTTMLNALSAAIPPEERLITIEDSAELQLAHRHWIRMETRPGTIDRTGAEVTQRDLVRNSLRMRPDRIIVGEVRGAEVWDMLQAMNTGHEGSMTTVHANSTRDALHRLEMMCALTGLELPVSVVREHIATGIRLVAHVARLPGGARKMVEISEIVGVKNGEYVIEDIFRFQQTGIDSEGNAVGDFVATGYIPRCLEKIRLTDVGLPENLFEKRTLKQ